MSRHALLPALALAVLLPACGDSVGPAPDSTPPPHASTVRSFNPIPIVTLDDEFERLADEVPGFGGIYTDPNGRLHVYLADPSRLPRARGALRAFLERRIPTDRAQALVSAMAVVPGRYDFKQLRDWHRAVAATVNVPGITQTDVDDRHNRVTIGVADEQARRAVRASLARLGLPADAVAVKIIPPTNITSTLTSHVRPLVGGLRIAAPGGCTLSFSAYHGAGEWWSGLTIDRSQGYFVTNSHCTSRFAILDGDRAGQPSLAYPIGTEISDPPLFTNAQDASCPVGRQCRYSDAALFRYDPGVSFTYARIAKPSGTTIVGGWTLQNQNSDVFYGVGMGYLRKVGSTTGATTGMIMTSCATVRQYASGIDTGRDLICQHQVGLHSSGGDSGAPVIDSSSDPRTLYGVHWGTTYSRYNDPSSPIYATFSPFNLLGTELYNDSGVRILPCDGCVGYF